MRGTCRLRYKRGVLNIAIKEGDLGTLSGKCFNRHTANTGCATCDENRFALEAGIIGELGHWALRSVEMKKAARQTVRPFKKVFGETA